MTDLNRTTWELSQLNNQISSGRQMSKISDNPGNLVSALTLRSNISEIKQYKENLTYGYNLVSGSESSLTQIKEQVMRAKLLNVQAINGALSTENLRSMGEEVRHLFEQSVILANTQVNGKYLFGGYRTTGYNDIEPTPFMAGFVDGYRLTGSTPAALSGELTTGQISTGADLAAGDLLINGEDMGIVDLTTAAPSDYNLNMGGAFRLADAINTNSSTTTATVTTLYAGLVAQDEAPVDLNPTAVSFDLNNIPVSVNIADGRLAADVAQDVVDAINLVSEQTGVQAVRGDGTNGGIANSVVLSNMRSGDDNNIVIANMNPPGPNLTGLVDVDQVADDQHNTGTVSMSSEATAIDITTSAAGVDDSILNLVGLDGGGIGFADEIGDGVLVYGYQLADQDLILNGQSIAAPVDDGVSTIFADTSAASKAAAINLESGVTGVTAVVTPASFRTNGVVTAGNIGPGDLVINGVDIFPATTTISARDDTNALVRAINTFSSTTGINATRNTDGNIMLSAVDGRNMHIVTSANGERISHLNGGSPAVPQSKVYYGSVQLKSDRVFSIETTPTASFEQGLAALGMSGGATNTGEAGDLPADGLITVDSIIVQEGNVRYTGDRSNDISIKVGQRSTLKVSKNGQDVLMDINAFSTLKRFEDFLKGQNFTEVVGNAAATDVTATLGSGDTGLPRHDELVAGDFTLTVMDHEQYPPVETKIRIPVDPAIDTPETIAQKINGVAGITATWNSSGYMEIESTDAARYTFVLESDSSNFLKSAGVSFSDIQTYSLGQSLAEMNQLAEDLTRQISDFGARANRIETQNEIFINLELSTTENLSEKQDTDIIEALMKLKAKEVAYEAALSASAKVMQLSLVNFL